MRIEDYTACSDLHHGMAGHPANDETLNWWQSWPGVPEPKLCLGDMNELIQFTRQQIGELAPTHVDGNHDPGSCGKDEVRIGDTIFCHGAKQFDPWSLKWLGPPVTWLVGRLERWWPDADVRLAAWFQRRFHGGRHGEAQRYVKKAAAYARKKGATQIVFGHLHQLINVWVDGVHVVCVGSCCNDRMDFVRVKVRSPE